MARRVISTRGLQTRVRRNCSATRGFDDGLNVTSRLAGSALTREAPTDRLSRLCGSGPFILSFLAHTAMIGAAMVVGIVATTGLPDPPRSTSFMMAAVAAPDVQPPRSLRTRSSTPAANPDASTCPRARCHSPDQHDLPDAAPDGAGAILGAGDPVGDLFGTLPPPPPLRVGGVVRQPQKVHHVAPVYPAMAQSAHVTGTVILEALIAEDGSVGDVKSSAIGRAARQRGGGGGAPVAVHADAAERRGGAAHPGRDDRVHVDESGAASRMRVPG